MSSIPWKSVFISSTMCGVALLLSTGAMAGSTTDANSLIINPISDIKADSQKSRVASAIINPSDWQYTSLEGVATKYGCNTNFNNQPVSQSEFSRGLSNCLAKVEPMLANHQSNVTDGDIEVIKRLTQEFRAQLSEIDTRINKTETRIAQVQANQFSTTTKLKGEAIFNLTGALSGGNPNNGVFGDRVRILLETSFNGQDTLWTRLATGNQTGISGILKNAGTSEGSQVAEATGAGSIANAVGIDWLAYQFPLGNKNVYVAAYNGIHVDYAPTYGSNFEDATGGNGALSNFAESSPIYKIGGGAGAGTTFPISDTGLKSATIGYLAGSANSPSTGKGLFNGDYALLGQLNFNLSDKLDAGLTYVNSYHANGNAIYGFGGSGGLTGTGLANANTTTGTVPGTTNANSYGAEFTYKASNTMAVNGFVLNTSANKSGPTGKQDIWSYGAGVSFPNVDGKGSLFGVLVGAEPYVGGVGTTPYHIEGFYKYKLSDNLSITPGLIYLTAPNQINSNSALIGVVRTTFTF